MILTTTGMRLSRLRGCAKRAGHQRLLDELDHVVLGEGLSSRSKVSVEICYSAGLRLREEMLQWCYTSKDTMRRGLSSSEHGALKDLVGALNEEARHPAMRNVGMEGHHARVFHVWPIAVGSFDRRWTPDLNHPGVRGPMVVLAPTWHIDDNYPSQKLTLWSPAEGGQLDFRLPSRLDDPELHWSFV